MGIFSMWRTMGRLTTRHIRRHPGQSVLMVLGISLGVAVIVGVDLANESASRAFELSTTALTGRATHQLSAGSQGFDEEIYITLRREGFAHPTAPVVTDYITSPQLGSGTLQVVGIDPFVEADFRDFVVGEDEVPIAELTAFLTNPEGVLISRSAAERNGLEIGSRIDLKYSGVLHPMTIVGLLDSDRALNQQAVDEMVVMDIATAQEITGKLGRLDRVDLILPADQPGVVDNLQQRLPEGVRVISSGAQNGIVSQMTRAFRINLTALSLLAMVVALFLIYNTMTFSITQRRQTFGILRSIGMTGREIFGMVIAEALIISMLGTGLGLALGILMGRSTVGLVTQTINDLFFVTTVRDVALPGISLFKGGVVGIAATVITAAFPAREAVRIPPHSAVARSSLETRARMVIPWISSAGGGLLLAGGGLLAIPSQNLYLSFGATFVVILGLAMLTPLITRWLMSMVQPLTEWLGGTVGRMAPREVVNAISRTSVAAAALMIAVAVTIGVSLMVNSFRGTVTTWLDQILQGDIYISVAGETVNQPGYPLKPEVIETLQTWEPVQEVDLLQTAVVESPAGPIQISASNNARDGVEQLYRSTTVPPREIWSRMQDGAVLVSEPLANRLDLDSQDAELALYTPQGLVRFPVAGVYYDYSSTQGTALLALDVYRSYWSDRDVAAAALDLKPGTEPEETTRELQEALSGTQTLLIRPNQAIRQETMTIFERTFAITGTLQVMTTIVAFTGVLSAMMSLQLDKKRQMGILRAVGLTGRQLWNLVLWETGLTGAVAGLFAMPTGYILSLILIYIINRRSFGWTLQMEVHPWPFLQALGIAVGASLLAGVIPARRILQRSTADAIRFE